MTTDTKLNQLIINKLTQEQYDEAKAAGTLSDTELYITDSDDEALTNNNISNCITYIPQDIKLELNNNNIIVLKKGSIVYIPNGTENFDKITITQDVSDDAYSNRETLLFYKVGHEALEAMPVEFCFSGATAPTSFLGGNYAVWYDTTNNVIKLTKNGGSTWDTNYSFPICLAHETTTTYSISQVFNGFGYIGSTIYALPGVKGLIPNGRNADGSLKNIEFVNDRVRTFTASGSGYGLTYFLNPDITNLDAINTKAYAEKDTKLTTFDNNIGVWFDTKQNIMLRTNDSGTTWTRVNYVCFSYMFMTNAGHLDYLVSKTVFHALDYNDKSTISGWSIPDYNSGITLTFSKVFTNAGESKTMAKSGLFCFEFLVNNVISTIYFYVNNCFVGKIGNSKTSVGFWDEINFPVTKGDVVKVTAEIDGGFTAAAVESYLFPYKGSMYE